MADPRSTRTPLGGAFFLRTLQKGWGCLLLASDPCLSDPGIPLQPPCPISFLLIHLIIYLDLDGTDVVTFFLIVTFQPVRPLPSSHSSAPRIRQGMRVLSESAVAEESKDSSPLLIPLLPLPLSPFLSYTSALFHFPYPVSPVFAALTKTTGVYTNSSHSGTPHSPLGPSIPLAFPPRDVQTCGHSYDPSAVPLSPCPTISNEINTYKSDTKKTILSISRINTYEKHTGVGADSPAFRPFDLPSHKPFVPSGPRTLSHQSPVTNHQSRSFLPFSSSLPPRFGV
jgi:hypothetical protein